MVKKGFSLIILILIVLIISCENGKETVSNSANKDQLTNKAMEFLVQDLKERKLMPKIEGNKIIMGISQLTARCSVEDSTENPQFYVIMVQIDLDLGSPYNKTISEHTVGIGKTKEESINKAVKAWIDGVLPPILELVRPSESEDIDKFQIETNKGSETTKWDVIAGPIQIRGKNREPLINKLKEQQPFSLINQTLLTQLARKQIYWFKLLLVKADRNTKAEAECAFNNMDWPEGNNLISKYNLPDSDGMESFSQFFIVKPTQ